MRMIGVISVVTVGVFGGVGECVRTCVCGSFLLIDLVMAPVSESGPEG